MKLNLFDSDGISLEEFLGFGFGLVCYITAFFAGRERKVVGLNNNLSLQEQFEMLETHPQNLVILQQTPRVKVITLNR